MGMDDYATCHGNRSKPRERTTEHEKSASGAIRNTIASRYNPLFWQRIT
jgi:hypothetical protein